MRSNQMLSVAESLTGGEICSSLIDITGISTHFYEGIVCYNSDSKIRRLGVSKKTLAENGVISKKTAYEMVKGLLINPAVTLGLATTGLAGPTADEGKDVGLVYIAVGSGDFITVFEHNFSGSRNEIRKKSANMAIFYLIRYLQGNILLL
ncbi:MAG TPA: CinA family protein, partial [Clostridia bacterium]|nr:CinA family protein [Clostridia bacterium]